MAHLGQLLSRNYVPNVFNIRVGCEGKSIFQESICQGARTLKANKILLSVNYSLLIISMFIYYHINASVRHKLSQSTQSAQFSARAKCLTQHPFHIENSQILLAIEEITVYINYAQPINLFDRLPIKLDYLVKQTILYNLYHIIYLCNMFYSTC